MIDDYENEYVQFSVVIELLMQLIILLLGC